MKYLFAIAIVGTILVGCEKEHFGPCQNQDHTNRPHNAPQPTSIITDNSTNTGSTSGTTASNGADNGTGIVDPNADSDATKKKVKN